jgi:hypothetical protein
MVAAGACRSELGQGSTVAQTVQLVKDHRPLVRAFPPSSGGRDTKPPVASVRLRAPLSRLRRYRLGNCTFVTIQVEGNHWREGRRTPQLPVWLAERREFRRGRVRRVPSLKGLGFFSHSTQHSAFGCVLGYPIPRLRRWFSRPLTPIPRTKVSSHAPTAGRKSDRSRLTLSGHFAPLGYTRILLASPVFRRSIPQAKSFMAMRSVMTGCRSSLPALSSAVIWYQV